MDGTRGIEVIAVDVDKDRARAIAESAMRGRERLHSGRSRTSALVTLAVLGGIGLLVALLLARASPGTAPSCDGRTMTRHDVCVIHPADGRTYTYQEMIDRRESRHTVWRVLGYGLAGLCVVLVIPVARVLDPAAPWGTRVAGCCPWCGGRRLREKRTTYSVSRGRTTRHYPAIVTLCTPTCGFSSVRRL